MSLECVSSKSEHFKSVAAVRSECKRRDMTSSTRQCYSENESMGQYLHIEDTMDNGNIHTKQKIWKIHLTGAATNP